MGRGANYVDERVITSRTEKGSPVAGDLLLAIDAVTNNLVKIDLGNLPTSSGDMVLASPQTVTGAKTFLDDTLLIENPAETFEYIIQAAAITSDLTLSLPLITTSDTLVSLGISNIFTITPQIVGDGTFTKTNPSIVIDGTYSTAANGRGYLNEKSIDATGVIGYANFDAAAKTIGTENYDHIAGFQSRPEHNSSGTLSRLTAFQALVEGTGGLITDVRSFEARDLSGSVSATNQYGFSVRETLNKATNNFGFHSVLGNFHRFGGELELIEEGGTAADIKLSRYSNVATTNGCSVIAQRSRGTEASPIALIINDKMLRMLARGHDGTSFTTQGALEFLTTEPWTVSDKGNKFVVSTTPNGSTTITERFTIGQDGSFDFTSGANTNLVIDETGSGNVVKIRRGVQIVAFDFATDVTTGDGKFYFHIDSSLGGMDLVDVHAEVITAGTTGTTDIQIANVTQAADMLSTVITIDSTETGSDTAAAAAVIDTSNDDVATNDLIRIDVDAISTTAPKGLLVTLGFRTP